MTWLILNLPFMLIGVAMAIGPLLYQHWRDRRPAHEIHHQITQDVLADLERLPVGPATRRRAERALSGSPAS